MHGTAAAGWQSGHAADCKSVYAGSIPTPASKFFRLQASPGPMPPVRHERAATTCLRGSASDVNQPLIPFAPRRGGETGRHSGLKIRRPVKRACRFDSGPRHHAFRPKSAEERVCDAACKRAEVRRLPPGSRCHPSGSAASGYLFPLRAFLYVKSLDLAQGPRSPLALGLNGRQQESGGTWYEYVCKHRASCAVEEAILEEQWLLVCGPSDRACRHCVRRRDDRLGAGPIGPGVFPRPERAVPGALCECASNAV
jgi:hypothetical protein